MDYIQPDWPAPRHVRAVATTRRGGVSAPPYHSFNLARHVDDDTTTVETNRSLLATTLALPESSFIWLTQVHGQAFVDAGQVQDLPEADASYCQQSGKVCVVLTADCLPVLLCDREGKMVMAVHAGWRGLAANILGKAMDLFGSPNEVLVWLGPAIGPKHFEVGAEVRAQFSDLDPQYGASFEKRQQTQSKAETKYLADIYQLARTQLSLAGLPRPQCYGGDFCTYADKSRFYSYRRDGARSGRMATAIWLQD